MESNENKPLNREPNIMAVYGRWMGRIGCAILLGDAGVQEIAGHSTRAGHLALGGLAILGGCEIFAGWTNLLNRHTNAIPTVREAFNPYNSLDLDSEQNE